MHEHNMKLLKQDEYHEDFDDLVYDIYICWLVFFTNLYCLINNYIIYNDNDDMINDVLIDNLEVECKKNIKNMEA